MPLLLLFRKKSRSARLFVCKRTHLRLTVATNFLRSCLRHRVSYVFLSSSFNHTLSMLDQALYRLLRFFYTKNQSSLIPLLLLLRKKSRSRRLLICKRIRNAFGSLPTFCKLAKRYIFGFIKTYKRLSNNLQTFHSSMLCFFWFLNSLHVKLSKIRSLIIYYYLKFVYLINFKRLNIKKLFLLLILYKMYVKIIVYKI